MATAREIIEGMLLDHRGPGTTMTGVFSGEQEAALVHVINGGDLDEEIHKAELFKSALPNGNLVTSNKGNAL